MLAAKLAWHLPDNFGSLPFSKREEILDWVRRVRFDRLSPVWVDALPRLAMEMADLIRFKTSTLTAIGFQRNGVWGEETASQRIEHLGLMFGALAASLAGIVKGRGVPLSQLTFGLLIFPSVWDWYLQWREQRRGFYPKWEEDMLMVAQALTRQTWVGFGTIRSF